MRRLGLTALLLVGLATPAIGGSYTIQTTPAQDAALAAQLAQPTIFTIRGVPPKTPQQYIEDHIRHHLDALVDHAEERAIREQRAKGKK